jgi:hypothetical protein
MLYRVMPNGEWLTLTRVYGPGEEVELSEVEATRFVGYTLEGPITHDVELVETNEETPVQVPAHKVRTKKVAE